MLSIKKMQCHSETGEEIVIVVEGQIILVEEDLVCCGSPLVVNGFLDEAEANARTNVNILKKWADKGYPVITCCTSCGLMLKQEYQELFHIDGIHEYAKHLYDAAEFLLELDDKARLNTNFGTLNEKYIYHSP